MAFRVKDLGLGAADGLGLWVLRLYRGLKAFRFRRTLTSACSLGLQISGAVELGFKGSL